MKTTREKSDLSVISTPSLELRRRQAEIVLMLTRILRENEQKVSSSLGEQGLHDITSAQANVLMVLFQAKEPLTASQVAEILGVSEVTVARFVKALTSSGWVDRLRSERDARMWHLKPTSKAYDALPKFIRVSNQMLDETFDGFSIDDFETLWSIISRVRVNLHKPE
ncbi:MAG: MarR family transcriptional regulator [Myxococcota bacterium]|nr:MarR family transcriptional regulator [Myxococcota bacterium]